MVPAVLVLCTILCKWAIMRANKCLYAIYPTKGRQKHSLLPLMNILRLYLRHQVKEEMQSFYKLALRLLYKERMEIYSLCIYGLCYTWHSFWQVLRCLETYNELLKWSKNCSWMQLECSGWAFIYDGIKLKLVFWLPPCLHSASCEGFTLQ